MIHCAFPKTNLHSRYGLGPGCSLLHVYFTNQIGQNMSLCFVIIVMFEVINATCSWICVNVKNLLEDFKGFMNSTKYESQSPY